MHRTSVTSARLGIPILLVVPFLFGGCPPETGPGPSPSPVADAERMASIDEVQQAVDAIGLDGDPAKTDMIADTLKGMSAFSRVEAVDGTVFARFADGELLVVMNNRPSIDDEAGAPRMKINDERGGMLTAAATVVAGRSARTKNDSPRSAPAEGDPIVRVPESKKAIVVNTMGTDYCDLTDQIGKWLSDAGYARSELDGSVESFRTGVKDVGVLYYNGHGVVVPQSAFTDGVEPLFPASGGFNLWTTTFVSLDNFPAYRNEVATGILSYGIAPTNRVGGNQSNCLDHKGASHSSETHYLLTERFIRKNWTCKKGALLYFDACHTTQSDSILPQVCLMPPVGASAVVGWDAAALDSWSTPTALYFFDRLLGANDYIPFVSVPRRPFGLNATLAAMKTVKRMNLPLSESKSYKSLFLVHAPDPPEFVANLKAFFADDTSDIVLRPGVKATSVNEGMRHLILEGEFGEAEGEVTLNGSALALADSGWSANRIECEIARDATGEIMVKSGDRFSNPRRLTQWKLTLNQLFMDYPTQQATDCPSCFYEATIHYTIRGDVGGTRETPEDDVAPPGFTGSAIEGDVEVTNAGGTYSIGMGSSITLAPNADDGAALIGTCIGFSPPADNNYFGACYLLDGGSMSIDFRPTLFAEGLFRDYHGGALDGIVDPYQISYSGNIEGRELTFSLSPNYNIEAGQKSTGPNSYFQWESADAVNPAQTGDPR